ncbi:hypothetical protein H70737_01370 [Paenibacillus sp. FSL H7-0737]|nr:hypothetical protein H70737_01370 [Paenibacillus sp. FSL H7-0737]
MGASWRDLEIAGWRSYEVIESRGGVFAEYRLRWLRNGGVMEWRGTELQVTLMRITGSEVTEWRDNT